MCYKRPMKAIALLLLLAGCTAAETPTAAEQPAHTVDVLSVSCSPNAGRPRADVSVRNTGTTTIEYPSGTVSFGGAVFSGHLNPHPLRPGGTASMMVFANNGDSDACSLVSVMDGDGFSASLRKM